MRNPRITKKEWGLVKGALRRVFSRSDLRRNAIERTIVRDYIDLRRPRVKTWCKCPECRNHFAKSEMEVDHVSPVVPVTKSLYDMTADELVDNIWSVEQNLRAMCKECHTAKTRIEARERARNRKKRSK